MTDQLNNLIKGVKRPTYLKSNVLGYHIVLDSIKYLKFDVGIDELGWRLARVQ